VVRQESLISGSTRIDARDVREAERCMPCCFSIRISVCCSSAASVWASADVHALPVRCRMTCSHCVTALSSFLVEPARFTPPPASWCSCALPRIVELWVPCGHEAAERCSTYPCPDTLRHMSSTRVMIMPTI
jgi:hypothetical protein